MTFQKSIETCMNKYADFKGKASRSEFWWFTLFTLIIGALTYILDVIIFPGFTETLGTGPLRLLFNVAIITPGLAVGSRRLHDTNRSGWWQLLYITVIGIPVVLIFMTIPNNDEQN